MNCSSVRCLFWIVLVLLLSARAEGRPLTPFLERRKNLSLSIERTKQVGREAMKNQYAWPKRSSPGGPDQQHHSQNN
ncbi:hypothetical protein ACOSP7_011878 [Xanthoceras sorbifolium]